MVHECTYHYDFDYIGFRHGPVNRLVYRLLLGRQNASRMILAFCVHVFDGSFTVWARCAFGTRRGLDSENSFRRYLLASLAIGFYSRFRNGCEEP